MMINLKVNTLFFAIVANTIFLSQTYASDNFTVLTGHILNKKSIDEQNKAHPYDVILLPAARDFYLKEEGEEYKKIKEIQLNYLDVKYKVEYSKPAKITCKGLYSADSMFHYTNLICVVDKISYIK
ncbi:hypothetical protein [Acinetobacter sp. Tr-809]|uniref:hypothetical protein n=1 Tax=Acinetobacter sp. Tr-809 TaxID=2608324 RepID=UPI001D189647|nr:hypothetical protein [Acinetobacter sp. Tr-809]